VVGTRDEIITTLLKTWTSEDLMCCTILDHDDVRSKIEEDMGVDCSALQEDYDTSVFMGLEVDLMQDVLEKTAILLKHSLSFQDIIVAAVTTIVPPALLQKHKYKEE
jgi:hypothetical protein